GPSKAELQQLAGRIESDIVGQLRAAGFTVLTYDDVKQDVSGRARMAANARYGMPTHDSRAFPGMDFVVATPADEQTLDYGLSGSSDQAGEWIATRGDYSFQVDDAAFQTGVLAVGHTLGKLITDAMAGRT